MSASPAEFQPPLPGEPAPWFHAVSAVNPRFAFSSVAGRYTLLAFVGPAGGRSAATTAQAMQALCAEGLLDDANRCAFLVTLGPVAPQGPQDRIPGLRVLADTTGEAYRAYRLLRPGPAAGEPLIGLAAFLLDPLLRVIAVGPLERIA